MIALIVISCDGITCGSSVVSTDEPIKQLFAKDTNDCVGIKGHKDTETCATLTDLKACGQSVTLKEAILSAITVDTCDGYSFKVFDLTERAEV